jgi:hypothetical protein
MGAPTVKMRMPSPIFYAFLMKFAEMLLAKLRNDQDETRLTMEHPFQKLAWCQAEHKDKNMSGAGRVAEMDPMLQFFTHHFKRCQIQ